MLLQSAVITTSGNTSQKDPVGALYQKGHEEKGEVVWIGGKLIFCCAFVLHDNILI